jgi:hypothetical protein
MRSLRAIRIWNTPFVAALAASVLAPAGVLAAEVVAAEPGVPAIAAATEHIAPGDTLVLSGVNLDDARLEARIAGPRQPSEPPEAPERAEPPAPPDIEDESFPLEILRSAPDLLIAVLPQRHPHTGEPLPHTVIDLTPVNERGAGPTIQLNAPEPWWVWPAEPVTDVEEIRLFGESLTPGGHPPSVFLKRDGTAYALDVTHADRHELRLALPSGLATGRYALSVHHHPDEDAARPPLHLSLREPDQPPQAVIDLRTFRERGEPIDEAIARAMSTLQQRGGGTLLFPAGQFNLDQPIVTPTNVPIRLVGRGHTQDNPLTLDRPPRGTLLRSNWGAPGPATVLLRGRGSGIADLTIVTQSTQQSASIHLLAQDQTVERVAIAIAHPQSAPTAIVSNTPAPGTTPGSAPFPENFRGANHNITHCHIWTPQHALRITRNTHYVRLADSTIRGFYTIGRTTNADAVRNNGGNNLIVERCDFRSLDRAAGRILGRTVLLYHSAIQHCYLADNVTVDAGPHHAVIGAGGNTGEQYLFHQRGDAPVWATVRQVTGDDALTLEPDDPDANLNAVAAAPHDWTLAIATGPAAGQWRDVASLDGRTLSVARPWAIPANEGDRVLLVQAFRRNLVLRNRIDCNPTGSPGREMRTMGAFLYGASWNNHVAHNTITNAAVGLALSSWPLGPTAFNRFEHNTITHMSGFTGDAADEPAALVHHARNTPSADDDWQDPFPHLGFANTFRRNLTAYAPTGVSIGWLIPRRIPERHRQTGEGSIQLDIVEHNQFLETGVGAWIGEPARSTIVRHNLATQDRKPIRQTPTQDAPGNPILIE